MWLLLGFFLVHIAMVILAGPINEIGSMITGRYTIKPERRQPRSDANDAEDHVSFLVADC